MTGNTLNLSLEHKKLLEGLFQKFLPGVKVLAYGSRITGESHPGSDLDLVLRSPDLKVISSSKLSALRFAIGESSIPFLVEVRDWAVLPKDFHKEIERNHVVLIPPETNQGRENL